MTSGPGSAAPLPHPATSPAGPPAATSPPPPAGGSGPAPAGPRVEPAVAPSEAPPSRGTKSRFESAQGWITVAIAIIALVLSVLNWVQLNSRPPLDVTLPRTLRVAQHSDGFTITIQPAMTVQKKSDLTTVVRDVRLTAEPLGSQAPTFRWVDVAAFVNNPQTRIPDWTYLADAAPLIVTQEDPQLPFLRFVTDDRLAAGDWRMSLVAEQDGQKPVVRSFCITILDEDRTYLDTSSAEYIFRTDRPLRAGQRDPACYHV